MTKSIVALIATTMAATAQTPLSVCQALSSASDHQELVIRGEISGSRQHGLSLSEGINNEPCPGSNPRLFTTPSFIPFGAASDFGITLPAQQEFVNRDIFARMRKELAEGNLEHRKFELAGILVRKPMTFIFRHSNGSYFGTGLGPDGEAPAILIVKSIREKAN